MELFNLRLPKKVLCSVLVTTTLALNAGLFADEGNDRVKNAIDRFYDSVKEGLEHIGSNLSSTQEYLEAHIKGVVEDHATQGVATLSHLKLNGHHRVVAVKPGERIEVSVKCALDKNACSDLDFYRVVIGIKGEGAQASIGNSLGILAGKSHEHFALIAPKNPGLYEIRFKTVEKAFEHAALKTWQAGDTADDTVTIGLIYVSKYAS